MISLTWNLMKQNKLMNKDIQKLRSIEGGKVGEGGDISQRICMPIAQPMDRDHRMVKAWGRGRRLGWAKRGHWEKKGDMYNTFNNKNLI